MNMNDSAQNGQANLSADDLISLRLHHYMGVSRQALAVTYGISEQQVADIGHYKRWWTRATAEELACCQDLRAS
jgi:hypothetical protein